MDRQEALKIYAQGVSRERECYLEQRVLQKAGRMSHQEKTKYVQSQGFENAVYQLKRRDKVYQGLQRGELSSDFYQTEFDTLAPLIIEEAERGNPVSLPFLRSVAKSRISLSRAHTALGLMEQAAPDLYYKRNFKRFVRMADSMTERFLLHVDVTERVPRDKPMMQVALYVQKRAFGRGISAETVDRAFQPNSLAAVLQREIEREYPELRVCGKICNPAGETVSAMLSADTARARQHICAEIRRQFPQKRIQRLLRQNDHIVRLQKQFDESNTREQRLRDALLSAVPEHYRDLYPLARQMQRHFYLHLGPTNSGKTHEGVQRLKYAQQGIYLGPLRLLAAEQFDTLNMQDVPCSLVTGEERILVPGSRVQASTVEMADLKKHYDVAVIDECQMMADRDRGGAWTAAILGLCADEIHACASPDAEGLLTGIIRECGDDLTVVRHERMTPLQLEKESFHFPGSVRQGDALIVFSKARVHAVAAELRSKGYRVSLVYGALPPDVRRDQAQRFQRGETEVVVSTDAIAMGMNLPIKRVVFLESEKYDGDITRTLTDAEFKQIAGRAGRYGIYDIGYVNAYGFKPLLAQALRNPLLPLTEAVIRFPESLLGIPLPLTQIINQWLMMEDKGCFSKASTVRMATLAAMLENDRTDKALLYRFLCIPFDETEPDLLTRWKAMYQAECRHEHAQILEEIPESLVPEDCTVFMLDGLEADYRRCDLYYNYARLFLSEPDEILNEIQRRKDLISQGIIHILSTQKLSARTCISCKRRLPWNWPYRLCDNCYKRQTGIRYHGNRRN
ncbi:MAG: hypothetical protein IJJ80_10920 [Clostridia bacterium]|nr:hypothetical protein [Clostridia bacterium]